MRHVFKHHGVERLHGAEFKTYELFIFWEFNHIIFLGHSKPRLTETVVTESADTGDPLHVRNLGENNS